MFRPCIDVKGGKVVQLEQGKRLALTDRRAPVELARIYAADGLAGGHVIDLDGGSNKGVILPALACGGLQVGGGITLANGREYLDAGATHLIFSSAVFKKGAIDWTCLSRLSAAFGKDKIVLAPDVGAGREIFVNRWTTATGLLLDPGLLRELAAHCAELLVHSIEVEGTQKGVDRDLARFLADNKACPVVYAGGGCDLNSVRDLHAIGLDLTLGRAYFEGKVSHEDLVRLNRELAAV